MRKLNEKKLRAILDAMLAGYSHRWVEWPHRTKHIREKAWIGANLPPGYRLQWVTRRGYETHYKLIKEDDNDKR